jgi:hypothetical protein
MARPLGSAVWDVTAWMIGYSITKAGGESVSSPWTGSLLGLQCRCHFMGVLDGACTFLWISSP